MKIYYNATSTARMIGISRNTFHTRIKKGVFKADGLFKHGSRDIPIYSEAFIETYKGIKLKPGRRINDKIEINNSN